MNGASLMIPDGDDPPMDTRALTVWDAITTRKSVRTFDGAPIEREILERCLEAARYAPSWANKQCWQFVLVNGTDEIASLGIVPAQIKNTPALLVACGDPTKSGEREGKQYYLVDVAIAIEHFVLEAWEQGLGTCWVGAFREDTVRDALGIPEKFKVVALVPVGYPAVKDNLMARVTKRIVGSANRKDLSDMVHYQKW